MFIYKWKKNPLQYLHGNQSWKIQRSHFKKSFCRSESHFRYYCQSRSVFMILKQGYVPPETSVAVLYQTAAFKCKLMTPKPLRHITAGIHFCSLWFSVSLLNSVSYISNFHLTWNTQIFLNETVVCHSNLSLLPQVVWRQSVFTCDMRGWRIKVDKNHED